MCVKSLVMLDAKPAQYRAKLHISQYVFGPDMLDFPSLHSSCRGA